MLAGSTHGTHTGDYMADLAASGGRVGLRERSVTSDEVGKPLADLITGLGHCIYRGQRIYGFWEPKARRLEAGDLIFDVVPRA